ncbi:MAG: MFS transporter [Caulobacteraceae bacterium]|nr:MFS transporter [Caulobacteraceae bacterium]
MTVPAEEAAIIPEAGPALTEARVSRSSWLSLAIFLLLYTCAFLDRKVFDLLVDPITRDLKISDLQYSFLQGAAFVVFYSTLGVPIGWAVDRFARRWIIFFGMIFWSLATMGSGVSHNYVQLMLSRIGVGAGEATLHPSVYSMLSDMFPRNRLTTAVGVYSVGASIGGAVSLVLGGLIVGLSSGASQFVLPLVGAIKPWQLVFLLAGAPGLLAASLVFLVREPARKGKLASAPRQSAPAAGSVLQFMRGQRGFFLAHFAAFSVFGAAATGVTSWSAVFYMRVFGLPTMQAALSLGVVTLFASTAGLLAAGWIPDWLLRRGFRDAHLRYYVGLLALFAVAGVTATLSHDLMISLGAMAVTYFCVPFIPAAAGALQITTPNEFRGQVSALFLLVYNIVSWGLGPTVVAAVSDRLLSGPKSIGTAMALTVAVTSPIAIALFAMGLKPMRKAVDAAAAWQSDR